MTESCEIQSSNLKFQQNMIINNGDHDTVNIPHRDSQYIIEDNQLTWAKVPLQIFYILKKANATIISFGSIGYMTLVNAFFLQRQKKSLLMAQFGLGVGFFNVIGFSILICFFQGFLSIASHAYGAKNFRFVGIILQRAQFVGLFICAFSIFLILNIENILAFFQINYNIAHGVYVYCLWSIPSLFATHLYDSTRFFCYSHKEFDIPLRSQIIIAAIYPIITYYFLEYLQLDIIGCGLIRSVAFWIQYFVLIYLMKKSDKFKETTIKYDKEALNNLVDFIKLTVPSGGIEYLKWIAGEITLLLSGFFNNETQIAALTQVFNIMMFYYMFVLGSSISINTLVSNAVGQRRLKLVQNYIKLTRWEAQIQQKYYQFIQKVCTISQYITFGFLAVIILVISIPLVHVFSKLLTTDEPMRLAFIKIYRIIIFFYFIGDFFQTLLSALLKSFDKQNIAVFYYILCYYFLGIPFAIFVGFFLKYEVYGLWIGLSIAPYAISIMFYLELRKINLSQVIQKIQLRNQQSFAENKEIEMQQVIVQVPPEKKTKKKKKLTNKKKIKKQKQLKESLIP